MQMVRWWYTGGGERGDVTLEAVFRLGVFPPESRGGAGTAQHSTQHMALQHGRFVSPAAAPFVSCLDSLPVCT